MAGRSTFALGLGLVVAVLSAGCGTLGNVKRPSVAPANSPDAPVCRVYGGLRDDWAVMSEFQWNLLMSYLDYVVIPVLATTDLALDVVGDTVTLPYTLAVEVRRGLGREAPAAVPPVAAPDAGSSARR